jgi:hypothetical protein
MTGHSTGRAVTPCSALCQASCRSPDDERGAGLLPEEVGLHVGITICEKSPAKAMAADKQPRGSGALPHGFSCCRICATVRVR